MRDDEQTAMEQLIDERDQAHEAADELAEAVAELLDLDIGEHSNLNDPWLTALIGVRKAIGASERRGVDAEQQAAAPFGLCLGPRRIKLTPARWGWTSAVVDDLMTTEPPWWRPTKRGARKVAMRYLRREQAREAREARVVQEEAS